jgi:hypothetical protein
VAVGVGGGGVSVAVRDGGSVGGEIGEGVLLGRGMAVAETAVGTACCSESPVDAMTVAAALVSGAAAGS